MNKSILHTYGKTIREIRLNNGITQEDLASRSGISLKYIQRIEGKNPPNIGIETLKKLCKALKISATELLGF